MTIEFKPGDRVKCVAWAGAFYTPGYVYTVQPGGILEGNDGRSFSYPLEQPFNDDRRFTLHAKAGEFAVGDKVVSIETVKPWLTAGKVYEVHRVLDGHVHISGHDSSDEPSCFYNSRFRLATPEEIAAAEKPDPGFKVGDLVEAINTTSGGRVMAGERVVVKETAEDFGYSPGGYINGYRAQNFRLISRPDAEGWHKWAGGENPVPGMRVNWRIAASNDDDAARESDTLMWDHFPGSKGNITAFRIVQPTPASAPPPASQEATYKRGDQVLVRLTLEDAIDEDGEFYAGYIKPAAIVGFDTSPKPLTVDDMASDGYFTGLIVFQKGDESVVEYACDGLVIRKTCDLVRA
jgi:hypothetical protein